MEHAHTQHVLQYKITTEAMQSKPGPEMDNVRRLGSAAQNAAGMTQLRAVYGMDSVLKLSVFDDLVRSKSKHTSNPTANTH